MTSTGRTRVFISYSHRDSTWLKRLQVHLKPLVRNKQIEVWDDTRIDAGMKWKDEIRRGLEGAGAAVLLISADFLASDFIAESELPPLLEAAETDGVVILPVILKPSRFTRTRLGEFQAVNDSDRPLIGLSEVEQEAIFDQTATAVERALVRP